MSPISSTGPEIGETGMVSLESYLESNLISDIAPADLDVCFPVAKATVSQRFSQENDL